MPENILNEKLLGAFTPNNSEMNTGLTEDHP